MDYQDKIFDIADKVTKFNFEEIWNMESSDIESNLNKKEASEEMFFKGIAYILEHLYIFEEINLDSIGEKIKTQT